MMYLGGSLDIPSTACSQNPVKLQNCCWMSAYSTKVPHGRERGELRRDVGSRPKPAAILTNACGEVLPYRLPTSLIILQSHRPPYCILLRDPEGKAPLFGRAYVLPFWERRCALPESLLTQGCTTQCREITESRQSTTPDPPRIQHLHLPGRMPGSLKQLTLTTIVTRAVRPTTAAHRKPAAEWTAPRCRQVGVKVQALRPVGRGARAFRRRSRCRWENRTRTRTGRGPHNTL
eukprot:gene15317-biopygen6662